VGGLASCSLQGGVEPRGGCLAGSCCWQGGVLLLVLVLLLLLLLLQVFLTMHLLLLLLLLLRQLLLLRLRQQAVMLLLGGGSVRSNTAGKGQAEQWLVGDMGAGAEGYGVDGGCSLVAGKQGAAAAVAEGVRLHCMSGVE
jgi:hypothetical protein